MVTCTRKEFLSRRWRRIFYLIISARYGEYTKYYIESLRSSLYSLLEKYGVYLASSRLFLFLLRRILALSGYRSLGSCTARENIIFAKLWFLRRSRLLCWR